MKTDLTLSAFLLSGLIQAFPNPCADSFFIPQQQFPFLIKHGTTTLPKQKTLLAKDSPSSNQGIQCLQEALLTAPLFPAGPIV